MKDKIMFLIIGILIGAIIATSVFLIYNKTISNNNENSPEMMQMNSNGQMGNSPSGNMQTPPEKPNGDNGQEPPAKPDGDTGSQPPSMLENSNNINN